MRTLKAGIVGLGLIGASLAKAYRQEGHIVYGLDIQDDILSFARLSGAVNEKLTEQNIRECDILLIAVNPGDAVAYLEATAPIIAPGTLVLDCCGIKRPVCEKCFPLAKKYGFTFVGGHPDRKSVV